MAHSPFVFTIFTPTYNRRQSLHRVYESLKGQTFRAFEWLIVDDGSTDGTAELVKAWQSDSSTNFPIRYVWQPNQHKKVAFNRAVKEALGEFLLPADSDDRFPPHALQQFARHWYAIPETARRGFAGVCGLCEYEDGTIVGDRFPGGAFIDSDSLEMRYRFRIKGEKWGFTRTDLLQQFPFPEHIVGHVPEDVVWSRLGLKYRTRFINEVVRTYIQESCQNSTQVTRSRNLRGIAPGQVYWKAFVLSSEIRWFWYAPLRFLRDAASLVRFGLHGREISQQLWPSSVTGRLLTVVMAPVGLLWWLWDRWKARRRCVA